MQVELNEICKTVGLVLGRRNIAPANRLAEDLGAESADILNIVATVEEKYGITIDDIDVPSVHTVEDLHGLVCRKVS